jgi:hypothetical protein
MAIITDHRTIISQVPDFIKFTRNVSFFLRAYRSCTMALYSPHILNSGSLMHKKMLEASITKRSMEEADYYDFSGLPLRQKCSKVPIDRDSITPEPSAQARTQGVAQIIRPMAIKAGPMGPP